MGRSDVPVYPDYRHIQCDFTVYGTAWDTYVVFITGTLSLIERKFIPIAKVPDYQNIQYDFTVYGTGWDTEIVP